MKNALSLVLALTTLVGSGFSQTGHFAQKEGFIDAHGVMIYYTEFGDGPPLVVAHGGPGASHDYFLPWLVPLARHHRVIFFDERGSGRSQRLQDSSQYNVDAMVQDLEDVRVALKLGKFSLLGHSYGGVLAEAYALTYQQNLTRLILNSTFASTSHMNSVLAREKANIPAEKLDRLNQLEAAGLFGKGEAWERNRYPAEYETLAWGPGYFPYMFGARPDANYDPGAALAPTNWELYRTMWGEHGEFVIDGNLKEAEYLDRLHSIKTPTLIIVGDHDECDSSLSKEIEERIAGSKLAILPNSGHMNFEDQPELWLRSVEDFLMPDGKVPLTKTN